MKSLGQLIIIPTIFFFQSCQTTSKSIELFNGNDLSGWHIDVPDLDDNPDGMIPFIVRDGQLVSLGTPQGHLISDEAFSNYRIETKYKFTGEPGNCGILVHASTPRSLYDMFPKSIEVQMMHENAGDFWCIVQDITVPNMIERRGPREDWGIVEGKKRRILNLTDGSENKVGEWNTMTIECIDDQIKVWVNDDFVNHGNKASTTSGQIAVQAEGSEVAFQYITLTPITTFSE